MLEGNINTPTLKMTKTAHILDMDIALDENNTSENLTYYTGMYTQSSVENMNLKSSSITLQLNHI